MSSSVCIAFEEQPSNLKEINNLIPVKDWLNQKFSFTFSAWGKIVATKLILKNGDFLFFVKNDKAQSEYPSEVHQTWRKVMGGWPSDTSGREKKGVVWWSGCMVWFCGLLALTSGEHYWDSVGHTIWKMPENHVGDWWNLYPEKTWLVLLVVLSTS